MQTTKEKESLDRYATTVTKEKLAELIKNVTDPVIGMALSKELRELIASTKRPRSAKSKTAKPQEAKAVQPADNSGNLLGIG